MRIGYSIAGAAKAASVQEYIIVEAVRSNELIARSMGGSDVVILATDIQSWLESKPSLNS